MFAAGVLVLIGFGFIIFLVVIVVRIQGKKVNLLASAGQLFKPGNYTSVGLDVVLVVLALGFLSWFWSQSYHESWVLFKSHDSFWATTIGLFVAIVGLKNLKHEGGKLFCYFVIALSVWNIGSVVVMALNKPAATEVVQVMRIKEEYTEPGKWSRPYTLAELEGVVGIKDREWQVCLKDPFTGKEVPGAVEPLPPGIFEKPWNTVWMKFRSPTRALKIEVKVPVK